MAQIDGLKRELKGLPGRRTRSTAGNSRAAGSDDEEDAGILELREELDRAKENEVIERLDQPYFLANDHLSFGFDLACMMSIPHSILRSFSLRPMSNWSSIALRRLTRL